MVRDALQLAAFTGYAQGFSLMREASKEYGYDLHFDEIAKIWRGGCIIRAKVLDRMRGAFARDPGLTNLMTAAEFAPMVNELAPSLRAAAGMALELGIPALGMCASLGYIDSYRTERLPQNLLQGAARLFRRARLRARRPAARPAIPHGVVGLTVDIESLASKIKLLLMDVDGVLTDGQALQCARPRGQAWPRPRGSTRRTASRCNG